MVVLAVVGTTFLVFVSAKLAEEIQTSKCKTIWKKMS